MKIKNFILMTAAALGMSSTQAAMVSIANHSFENGSNIPASGSWNNNNPEGWVVDESGGQIGMQSDSPGPAGTDGSVFAFVQGDTSSLLQDITSGTGSSTTVGDIFTLTLAALNQNASPSFDFDITDFSGNSLIGGPLTTPVAGNWADYVVAGTVDTASSEVRLVLNSNGPQIRMDNVRMDFQAIPEPSAALLLGIGGLAAIFRRRKVC